MAGCVPMLRKFLSDNKLPQTNRTYLMGSSDGIMEAENNFVQSDQFLKTLAGHMKSSGFNTGIQVSFYEEEENGVGYNDKI